MMERERTSPSMPSRKHRSILPSRREFVSLSSAAATPLPVPVADKQTGLPLRGGGPGVYTRADVRPYINCTALATINGGSAQLLEVIEAIHQASYYHVNLDELMAKVGPRIAKLLDAEAALVSSGAAGAVACATLACIAGGDPEKIQQVPNTRGLKNEVVIPSWSRITYDQAIRSVGAKIVEVTTLADLDKAFGPKTAMASGLIHVGEMEQYAAAAHRRCILLQRTRVDRRRRRHAPPSEPFPVARRRHGGLQRG
jgi:hypothetical protein